MSMPTDSSARKATPIFRGVLMYFPDAIASVARVSYKGNQKHNPGEPLHWARGKGGDIMDSVQRHLMEYDKLDPEDGEPALAHAAWRILAELQLQIEGGILTKGEQK